MPNAIQEATNELKAHLEKTIRKLKVLKEFPQAGQKLVYPSLTIFQQQPVYTPLQPYSVKLTAPDLKNKVLNTLVVGEHDLKYQLDLWCSSKDQRNELESLVRAALSPNIDPQGLRLQLHNYYGIWATFDLDGSQVVDDEAASQRQEWRVKFTLLSNFREVAVKSDYAIIAVESVPDLTDTI